MRIGIVNGRIVTETGFRTGIVNGRILFDNSLDAGELFQIEDDDTCAGAGFVQILGSLAQTEEDDQCILAGTVGSAATVFGSPEFIYLSDATLKYHFKKIK